MTDLTAWYRDIAEIIMHIGSPKLAEKLSEALLRLVPFDLTVTFVYGERKRPVLLYENFGPVHRRHAIATYEKGTYVLDPFYQAYLSGIGPGVYRLRDLAPDAFYQSGYFESYKAVIRPAEEAGYLTDAWPQGLEEIGIFTALPRGMMAVISLYRYVSGASFSNGELARLTTVLPVIGAVLCRHCVDLWPDDNDVDAGDDNLSLLDDQVHCAFRTFGRPVLSKRECEVVQLVLRGHSSRSIAYRLNISRETAKTHRKNAYAKLGVSSQAELFSMFLHHLTSTAPHDEAVSTTGRFAAKIRSD